MTSDSGSVHNIHYGDILVKYNEVVSLLHHNVDCLTVEGETHSPKDYVRDGDIIIADTAEDETVGKTVEIQDVGNRKVVAGLHTFLYRPPPNLFVRGWLGYWMNSSAYHSQLFQYMTGTKVLSLTRASIAATVIQYPSKELQRQIVTALDSIQTQINATQKLIAKYEAIKKATVNLLLAPKGTHTVRLGEVAEISRGGSPRPIQDFITADPCGINWIKIGDVSVDVKYIEQTEERIKPTGIAMSRQVKAGDFILSNSMSFGRPYILKIDGCIHDGWLAIQNYQNTFDVDYLYYLLGSDMVFTQYVENAAGSSVKNLNKDIVAKIRLPAPSLSEQREIAERITAIDKVLVDCRKQLDKVQNLKHGMMSYFFG